MKTKLTALIIAFLSFVVIGNVNAETEKRKVSSFNEVSLRISGTVYIEQGSTQSVEIEASSSTLEKIITEVKDDKLIIRFENNNYFWRNFNPGKIVVHITMTDVKGLGVSGSGDFIAENSINTDNITLAISGSGNIKLSNLKAENVKASISGSGDIAIENGGLANEMETSIAGSGNIKTSGFESRNVSVKVSGSGNTWVNATENLKVRVAGSGDVYYSGNADIDSSVAGSGSVKKMK